MNTVVDHHGLQLHQYADDCQVYVSRPGISNYCQIIRLCYRRRTLVERQPDTFEPGKDSPYLVGFISTSGEDVEH